MELRRAAGPTIAVVSGQLMATPPAGATFSRYEWYYNGTLVPGATGPTLTPMGPGTYRVQGDDGYCWAVSDLFAYQPAGLSAGPAGPRAWLSPNPVTRTLAVEAPAGTLFELRSATGQLLRRQPAAARLDLGELAPGLYFVSLREAASGQVLRREKLVKE